MTDAILFWNDVANETTRVDYSTVDPTITPNPEQAGPTRTSRALAIAHWAMYDAYIGVSGGTGWKSSYGQADRPTSTSVDTARAAVAAAATLTLIALYPRQRADLRRKQSEFLATLGATDAEVSEGIAWGRRVATAILERRQGDGSELSEEFYAPSAEPFRHRADPLNPSQTFVSPLWGHVKPFGVSELLTRVPGSPPPDPTSSRYLQAFREVASLGSRYSGARSPEQRGIGIFWAYDGARNIGVPPRLYNQVLRAISQQNGAAEAVNARLFAAANIAMADTGIHVWNQKYAYNVWRPIVGIREASVGYGPTSKGDGNPETASDPAWLPLGSPRTNQSHLGPFTPAFPAYPSGHAAFGAAAFEVARLTLALSDSFTFKVVSDELDGRSIDEDGSLRVRHERTLTIPQAIEENLASRVYLGVHWRFDGEEGKANGLKIGQLVHQEFR